MKRRKFWLVAIIVFATPVLVLWLRSRPPAKVVSIGTITLPKPIDQHWLSKQGKAVCRIEKGNIQKLTSAPFKMRRNWAI
ncbi:MAG: hypothetical protein N3B10_10075 [Armatimonadetes bacterium]|nr:hypothetical protein [Armatimonadota bacterium]